MIICQSFIKLVFHDDFAADYIEWWINEFRRKFLSEQEIFKKCKKNPKKYSTPTFRAYFLTEIGSNSNSEV